VGADVLRALLGLDGASAEERRARAEDGARVLMAGLGAESRRD